MDLPKAYRSKACRSRVVSPARQHPTILPTAASPEWSDEEVWHYFDERSLTVDHMWRRVWEAVSYDHASKITTRVSEVVSSLNQNECHRFDQVYALVTIVDKLSLPLPEQLVVAMARKDVIYSTLIPKLSRSPKEQNHLSTSMNVVDVPLRRTWMRLVLLSVLRKKLRTQTSQKMPPDLTPFTSSKLSDHLNELDWVVEFLYTALVFAAFSQPMHPGYPARRIPESHSIYISEALGRPFPKGSINFKSLLRPYNPHQTTVLSPMPLPPSQYTRHHLPNPSPKLSYFPAQYIPPSRPTINHPIPSQASSKSRHRPPIVPRLNLPTREPLTTQEPTRGLAAPSHLLSHPKSVNSKLNKLSSRSASLQDTEISDLAHDLLNPPRKVEIVQPDQQLLEELEMCMDPSPIANERCMTGNSDNLMDHSDSLLWDRPCSYEDHQRPLQYPLLQRSPQRSPSPRSVGPYESSCGFEFSTHQASQNRMASVARSAAEETEEFVEGVESFVGSVARYHEDIQQLLLTINSPHSPLSPARQGGEADAHVPSFGLFSPLGEPFSQINENQDDILTGNYDYNHQQGWSQTANNENKTGKTLNLPKAKLAMSPSG